MLEFSMTAFRRWYERVLPASSGLSHTICKRPLLIALQTLSG
jgi:hypothetical protein